MTPNARFVVLLGTGTAVGKTFVTQHLARAIATLQPDAPVLPLKPIETGVTDPALSDAASLAACARGARLPVPHPLYAFLDPISPHLAARHAATEIAIPHILSWLYTTLRATISTTILIETAGGVFSPLTPALTNFDLATALEPALWILVAPDALGVLHDLSATLTAMRASGRSPDLVLLSAARGVDASTGTNAPELASLHICEVAAVVPRGDPSPLMPVAATILRTPPFPRSPHTATR